jgi:protein-tyrosine phosphatase
MPKRPKIGVLFVCSGNICRSPIADAVFRARAARAQLARATFSDSAGTHGGHVGEPPDARAAMVAQRRGYDLGRHRARTVTRSDFARFDWILATDTHNLAALAALAPAEYRGHLGLLLDLAPALGAREVDDPYYGPLAGFDRVIDQCEAASDALIAAIAAARVS